ncbi:hypothetical protein LX36DRAFT_661783 [Colletotrichum falcatum]|nr:hypothetical protein LX36DRAFT_661783 [Colletotrichum falcatum]
MGISKTYFMLRSTDYKPDSLIELGQLIADPDIPYRRVAPPLKPLPADLIHHSLNTDWSRENSEGISGEAGIFGHFLTAFTAEAAAHASREFTHSRTAARLETTFLELGEDRDAPYVKESVKEAAVQKWLKRDRFRKRVLYMITGLKVARQPGEASDGESRTIGASAKLGGDPGTGGLVSFGVHGGAERSVAVTENSKPPDFVFAYRLRKIHISFHDKASLGKDVSGADLYESGFARDSDDSDTEKEHEEWDMEERFLTIDDINEVLVEEEDFSPYLPVGLVKKDCIDEEDGKQCSVVFPASTG